MYYVLTGNWITSEEADRIGMITKVVEEDKLMDEALELATASGYSSIMSISRSGNWTTVKKRARKVDGA